MKTGISSVKQEFLLLHSLLIHKGNSHFKISLMSLNVKQDKNLQQPEIDTQVEF